ncbi:NAD-dependent glucose-6-phosphate dehydrogenase [uncultured archaeon]|nr:NAD-dependent glucose-6-phosphate dehydrogenase [uncultured archaeon]
MKSVLVTGGAGFIGSHLAEQLAQKGVAVRVLDNFSSGTSNKPVLQDVGAQIIQGDVRKIDNVRDALDGIDTVFHLAAQNRAGRSIENPLENNDINVTGTLTVLEACRKHGGPKNFIFASSSSVYGGGTGKKALSEEAPRAPVHPYGVGKMADEEYCRVYHQLYGLNTVVLRYASVYGPRQRSDIEYAAVVPKFVDSILSNKPLTIFGDGKQTRPFTYVLYTVSATMLVAENKKAAGQVYNVANPQSASVNQIVEILSSISTKKPRLAREKPLPNEPKDNPIDSRKLQKLGWKPRFTFEQGLRAMVAWRKERRNQ